jgi:hypothetical protein
MDLEMVLNELSLKPPADNIEIAKQWMSHLISTIQAATKLGVARVLYTPENFYYVLLAPPDYLVAKWLGDDTVEREAKQFFKSLATKRTFFNAKRQYKYGKWKDVIGLGYADSYNALAISINSEAWPNDRLPLELLNLDDLKNGQDEFVESCVEVTHASCREHVQNHASWIEEQLQKNIHALASDESSLWKYKEKLFPHLPFCKAVKKQLGKNLLRSSSMLEPVVETLLKLDQYCEDHPIGPFDSKKIACEISGESQPTRQQYWRERNFECPDGERRTFDWHAKLADGWRIYFEPWIDPLENKGQLIIGYIGPHLPTVNERT